MNTEPLIKWELIDQCNHKTLKRKWHMIMITIEQSYNRIKMVELIKIISIEMRQRQIKQIKTNYENLQNNNMNNKT